MLPSRIFETDEGAPIQHIWEILNKNLMQPNIPYQGMTIDEQLFSFRGYSKLTQMNILHTVHITADGPRHVNDGEIQFWT